MNGDKTPEEWADDAPIETTGHVVRHHKDRYRSGRCRHLEATGPFKSLTCGICGPLELTSDLLRR